MNHIRSVQTAANSSQPTISAGKMGKQQTQGVLSTRSGDKSTTLHTSRDVAMQGSFQQFLNEQIALQTANTGSASCATTTNETTTEKSAEKPAEIVHVLRKGETIWDLARDRYKVDPQEILSLNKIANPGKLRVGQEIRIPTEEKDQSSTAEQDVVAGWYGKYHQGRMMANGKPFNMNAATIAHRDIPIGTVVELENPETGQKAEAVVTDRGPYHRGRDVDLSYGLAKRLSVAKQGVANLKMRVL